MQNWVKVNFDASISSGSRLIRIGAVIRNDEGNFLAAMSKSLNIHTNPSSAEAIAALYATKFARDHHLPHVAFEGDAMVVVNQVSSNTSNAGPFGHIIDDIIRSLLPCF